MIEVRLGRIVFFAPRRMLVLTILVGKQRLSLIELT